MKKTVFAALFIFVLLAGCGVDSATQSGVDIGEKIQTESSIDVSEVVEEQEKTYSPDRYGQGFYIDFCGEQIVAYEESDVDPNREINLLMNKMLYCIQSYGGIIPGDAKFLEPELVSKEVFDGGDPDDPDYPTMRSFDCLYRFPVKDQGYFDILVSIGTWIGNDTCYFDELDGLSVSISSDFDGCEYYAFSLDEMTKYELGGEYSEPIGYWDLTNYVYTEAEDNSVVDDSWTMGGSDLGEIGVSPSLQSDLALLRGYGFNPYENNGVWYCNIGCGTIEYSTKTWVAAHSQIRLEPHWEGWVSGMIGGKYILSTKIYSTDLVNFFDYSDNAFILGRNGLR